MYGPFVPEQSNPRSKILEVYSCRTDILLITGCSLTHPFNQVIPQGFATGIVNFKNFLYFKGRYIFFNLQINENQRENDCNT